MTNFDIIAGRIIRQEGMNFAVAASAKSHEDFEAAREALKRAIVEALEDVLIAATGAMCKPTIVYPDRSGSDVVKDA